MIAHPILLNAVARLFHDCILLGGGFHEATTVATCYTCCDELGGDISRQLGHTPTGLLKSAGFCVLSQTSLFTAWTLQMTATNDYGRS
ncbi:MAG: hypothetical protein AB7I12_01275 [Steroidobacteraceae bacterium]